MLYTLQKLMKACIYKFQEPKDQSRESKPMTLQSWQCPKGI